MTEMVESTSGMSHIRNVASHTSKSGAGYDKHGHGGDDDDHDGGEGNQDEGFQIFRHVVSHMLLLEIEIMNMVEVKMNKMTESKIQMKESTSGMSHIRECLESHTAAAAGEIRNNSHSHSSAVSYQSYHVTFPVYLIISNTF